MRDIHVKERVLGIGIYFEREPVSVRDRVGLNIWKYKKVVENLIDQE